MYPGLTGEVPDAPPSEDAAEANRGRRSGRPAPHGDTQPLSPAAYRLRGAACALYAVCVVFLSLTAPEHLPGWLPPFPGADKLAHLGIYGLFALLAHWAIPPPRRQPRIRALTAVGAIAGFGLLMEILQASLTGDTRGFEWWDVAANTVGAAGGWLAAAMSCDR